MNTINQPIQFRADQYQVNYNKRNTPPMPQTNTLEEDIFLLQANEMKKAQKKAKSQDRWNKAGVIAQMGIALGIIGSVLLSLFALKKGMNGTKSTNVEKLITVDVSKEKSFEELCLPKELKKVVEDLKVKIERKDALAKKGYKKGSGIILYGEPGGGKNAFTYALTKFYQKLFPGSELIMVDVNKFKGMYNGETENNIINFVSNIQKKSAANPDKKFIVFLDEFDSIAKKAAGSANENSSESFQNAFKTTLTSIMDIPNVEVIAATNKATKGEAITKYLDSAIANRFPEKIYVPLPTKEQLKNAFVEHFKRLPNETVVGDLKNIDNKVLNSVCEYISEPQNHASFRDFTNIIDHAKIISEGPTRKSGAAISTDDLIDAVIKHADGNNWDVKALNNFRKAHNRPTVKIPNNYQSVMPTGFPNMQVQEHRSLWQKFVNFFTRNNN